MEDINESHYNHANLYINHISCTYSNPTQTKSKEDEYIDIYMLAG